MSKIIIELDDALNNFGVDDFIFELNKNWTLEPFVKRIYVEKCSSCNDSGYYDNLDENGNSIKCGCCNGTGEGE